MSDEHTQDIHVESLNGWSLSAAIHTQQLAANLADLRQTNTVKLNQLGRQGAKLEQLSCFAKRLEMLIDRLLPDGSDDRFYFEINYETEIGKVLDDAGAAVRRAILTQSAAPQPMPKLFSPEDPRG